MAVLESLWVGEGEKLGRRDGNPPLLKKNSGLACYSNTGLRIYLMKFSFYSCYSDVGQTVKLIARIDRFYESGMYFIRIFFRRGAPGAEAEEKMLHIYNCFNVRLLGEPYFVILVKTFLENSFGTRLSLSLTPNK